ncbi:MAG: NAD(P)-dependent oxidoreductase [Weeksellaceae bacterium]
MKIGFIGLGNMGFGMVTNLLKAKHQVIVYDIDETKVKEIVSLGAKQANKIEQMSEVVECVILCLPHPKISKEVIESLVTNNTTIKTIIDTSTLTPEDSQEIYNQLKSKNIAFLCAPMLGGKTAALEKNIHFLVEGDETVFETYKVVLHDMASRVDYMGALPAATLAKLAYNICRYSNLATAAEVSRFLRSYTSDTQSIYQLLSEGSLDNFGQVWKEDITDMILQGKEYQATNIPDKDLSLVVSLAQKQNVSDKLFSAIKEVYKTLVKSH